MTLISQAIPNLINGVSQQPAAVRLPSQCGDMVNCYPTVDEFLHSRPPTKHLTRLLQGGVSDAHIHVINRDEAEQYIAILLPGTIRVFRLDGTEVAVSFPNGTAYLPQAKVSARARCMTINDYTFVVNTEKTVAMASTKTPARKPEVLAFIRQASYATTYSVTLDGSKTATHTTLRDDDAGKVPLSSTAIATDLTKQINAFGQYTAKMTKSTIHIVRKDGGEFSSKVEDSRSNTHMSLASHSVQRFTDLLTVAPDGFVCEVKGDSNSQFDNYYVRFEADEAGTFGQGLWVETVKPGIPYQLNPATMPHALVRKADGTFEFCRLTWADRVCGDEDSIPTPSFVGRKLASAFFYRNRLGFLANENTIMSEAGKFFNFFATTATTLLDSDPIDVAASHTKATSLCHAVPFNENLLLFSEQTQFKLEHPVDLLSTATVAITPLTSYESSMQVPPVGAGKNIFFVAPRGEYATIMEYYVQEDTNVTDAASVTGHVPRYVPASVHSLVASTNEDLLLLLSRTEPEVVTLYKYLWSGNEKLQSAWFRWKFQGAVLGAAFLETKIYLVVSYTDGLYLEVLDVQPGLSDEGVSFQFILDRKVTEKGVSAAYNKDENSSTVTLPYVLPANAQVHLVTRKTTAKTVAGSPIPIREQSGNRLVVEGDVTNIPFFVGCRVASSCTLSRQYLRDQKNSGPPFLNGRVQMRTLRIYYENTGAFQVSVTPPYRDTFVYPFTGRITTHGSNVLGAIPINSGVFQIPVLCRAEEADITISSESFLPFQIVNAEWEGFYHSRSSRF